MGAGASLFASRVYVGVRRLNRSERADARVEAAVTPRRPVSICNVHIFARFFPAAVLLYVSAARGNKCKCVVLVLDEHFEHVGVSDLRTS